MCHHSFRHVSIGLALVVVAASIRLPVGAVDAPPASEATFEQVEKWCVAYAAAHPSGKPGAGKVPADMTLAEAHFLTASFKTEKLRVRMDAAAGGTLLPDLAPSRVAGALTADSKMTAESVADHHRKAIEQLLFLVQFSKPDVGQAIAARLLLGHAMALGTGCGLWAVPLSDAARTPPNSSEKDAIRKALKELSDPKKKDAAAKSLLLKNQTVASWLAAGGERELTDDQKKSLAPALARHWGLEAVKQFEAVSPLAPKEGKHKNEYNAQIAEAGKAIVAIIDGLGMQKEYRRYAEAKKAAEMPVTPAATPNDPAKDKP